MWYSGPSLSRFESGGWVSGWSCCSGLSGPGFFASPTLHPFHLSQFLSTWLVCLFVPILLPWDVLRPFARFVRTVRFSVGVLVGTASVRPLVVSVHAFRPSLFLLFRPIELLASGSAAAVSGIMVGVVLVFATATALRVVASRVRGA